MEAAAVESFLTALENCERPLHTNRRKQKTLRGRSSPAICLSSDEHSLACMSDIWYITILDLSCNCDVCPA